MYEHTHDRCGIWTELSVGLNTGRCSFQTAFAPIRSLCRNVSHVCTYICISSPIACTAESGRGRLEPPCLVSTFSSLKLKLFTFQSWFARGTHQQVSTRLCGKTRRARCSLAAIRCSQEPSFKDRFSKLGAGVGEKFAAFGSIIQEHGHGKNTAAGGPTTTPKVADGVSAADGINETARVAPQTGASPGPPVDDQPQQLAMEYFQEYELTFSSEPKFSLVGGPGGKGAVVSWEGGGGGGAAAAGLVPPSGAAVIAVSGDSVVDRDPADVMALMSGGRDGDGGSRREREQSADAAAAAAAAKGGELLPEKPSVSAEGGAFPLVVRFRQKTGPGGSARPHEPGAAGGEVFRIKMKAMATGLGNFFQVKDSGGSVVRDGSGSLSAGDADGASPASASDAFVLTFSARGGTAGELPFTLAEMVGGLGVIVAAVRNDYAESLVKAEEAGIVSAGVAVVAAAAAGEGAGAGGSQAGGGGHVGVLEPGALLLRVAGQNVEGKGLQRARKVLEAAAAEHLAVSEREFTALVLV